MIPSAEVKKVHALLFSLTSRQRTALVLLLVSYVFYIFVVANQEAPIVQLSQGRVQGIILSSRNGREFYAYYGMPYAQSPVGKLRFEPPKPATNWDGVKSASSFGSPCIQVDIISGFKHGSEDCLFINVFSPKMPQKGKSHLPVMVFIHGGLFMSGASDFYGPNYFMDQNVVLVTLNYRLGVFGFLNTEDNLAKGNQGMKDVVMALKWVQQNIKLFNGDPNKVTIFGESAGGAAAHLLMLSPLSKGLFHKVISQSGTSNSPWLHASNTLKQAKRFATRVNCPTSKNKEMVECLRKISATDLVEQHRELVAPPRDKLAIFAPSVETVVDDNTFMAADHMDVMRNGSFTKVPWLLGVNAEEGLIFSAEIVRNSSMTSWARNSWETLGPVLLHYKPESKTSEAIKQYYFFNETNDKPEGSFDNIEGYTKVHSDRAFFVPVHKAAQIHSKYHSVYLYFFNYRPQTSIVKFLLSLRGEYNIYIELAMTYFRGWLERTFYGGELVKYGVCHADELQLLFNLLLMPSIDIGAPDYEISQTAVKSWTQFASDSKELSFGSIPWDAVSPNASTLRYMQMTENSSGMIDEPFTSRVRFWDSLSKLSSS